MHWFLTDKSVEVLPRICRWQKNLDESNSYQEAIGQAEPFSMDREFVEKLSRQIPESFDGLKMQ